MQNSNTAVLLESDTNELEIVEFRVDELDGEGRTIPCFYGVNVAKVREIIRLPHLWKVLNGHPAIPGMIKLRDKVITVVDLSVMLNKNVGDMKADRVVVLEFNRLVVAVMVHSVSRIYRISWEQVEPPVKTASSSQVTGLVKMNDRIILVLDFEKIIGELFEEYALGADIPLLPEGRQPMDRSNFTILVADDSPFIRNTITLSLRTAGYKVLEAENGEEALNLIIDLQNKAQAKGSTITDMVSLLISDIEMPKMDGLHLTSRIKKDEKLAELPIIIFSSLASTDNIRKWEALGAIDILTKPDLPKLVEKIDQLILV
ncbi:chemotaxis protein CheV [Geobacter sp. OR-1]|uniref:chemotaxis protein CheV n=1 Tax=Geobacter sp. OR-1 TaxID=1266765 RepID=UPI0005443358|nr:chemotaxis protein [Geobacter sp. OR-1]GAM11580.1 chemotaxis protein CheV [Geobacter sp. OR-1]